MNTLLRIGAQGPQVRAVQNALNRHLPLPPLLAPDGIFGPRTLSRVVEFQRRHQLDPDGVVGPRTSAKLFANANPEFIGFTDLQIGIILSDVDLAKRMLDVVNNDLITIPGFIARTSEALFNVFDIDLSLSDNPIAMAHEMTKLLQLKIKFARLRAGLDEPFTKQWEPQGTFAAYVIGTGPGASTMHITPVYFQMGHQDSRAVTLIHERAHTLCQPPNDITHPGTADVPAGCIIPHEDKVKEFVFSSRPFFDNAVRNPWCFEWFTLALQRDYNPQRYREHNVCGQPN